MSSKMSKIKDLAIKGIQIVLVSLGVFLTGLKLGADSAKTEAPPAKPKKTLKEAILWTMDQPRCQDKRKISEPGRKLLAEKISREILAQGGPRIAQEVFAGVLCKETAYGTGGIKSPAGALGIAQLMPATAQVEADRLGLGKLATEDLLDTEMSVRLGYSHFLYLYEAHDGNILEVLAAYNGGSRGATVKAMTTGSGKGAAETNEYVAKIMHLQEQRRISEEVTQ